MWRNPITEKQLRVLSDDWDWFQVIAVSPPLPSAVCFCLTALTDSLLTAHQQVRPPPPTVSSSPPSTAQLTQPTTEPSHAAISEVSVHPQNIPLTQVLTSKHLDGQSEPPSLPLFPSLSKSPSERPVMTNAHPSLTPLSLGSRQRR